MRSTLKSNLVTAPSTTASARKTSHKRDVDKEPSAVPIPFEAKERKPSEGVVPGSKEYHLDMGISRKMPLGDAVMKVLQTINGQEKIRRAKGTAHAKAKAEPKLEEIAKLAMRDQHDYIAQKASSLGQSRGPTRLQLENPF